MKNTLHIITGLGNGGAEGVLFRLCTQDVAHSHHVVSLMDEGKYGPLLVAQGTPVTTLGMKRGWVSLLGLWRLFRLIRQLRPDAIQTWMYHADLVGGMVARLAGHRNVIWGIRHTTLDPTDSPRSTIFVARLCARLSRIVPRRIVCCAHRARGVHTDLGYDPNRFFVIPNGYDLSTFRPDAEAGRELRREVLLSTDIPVIGFVARYDPQKDHENLLQALSILKKKGECPVCLLVGTRMDTDNTVLVDRIAALNLNDQVRLLGRRDDIPAVMNAIDLHVMSSAFGEAFPNVLAEAMACGTLCVSTDVGDAAQIIGETGHIVAPRNPQLLATAISKTLAERDSPLWLERRADARKRIADHFSIQIMVESYRNVWSVT